MGEICDEMLAMQEKSNHLGLEKSSTKSTAGDGLIDTNENFFQEFYSRLLNYFYSETQNGIETQI